ncbi:hypothetical protein HNW77_02735 [Komagataeibacter sp. AV436]|uniref:Uncharacterized protein n=1 Tax=Komagataeibacter melomenusus TaxID=2766578 RepID=A0ABX2AAE7_9PROT|nr:hypothetical protein [Komagataeibacter melomenusus]MBV1829851.1 hypothetical protein [Komagataeibacter melomenusus]NPC65339.1 hypothetical protein [Komagataeibacter melomenusus]
MSPRLTGRATACLLIMERATLLFDLRQLRGKNIFLFLYISGAIKILRKYNTLYQAMTDPAPNGASGARQLYKQHEWNIRMQRM